MSLKSVRLLEARGSLKPEKINKQKQRIHKQGLQADEEHRHFPKATGKAFKAAKDLTNTRRNLYKTNPRSAGIPCRPNLELRHPVMAARKVGSPPRLRAFDVGKNYEAPIGRRLCYAVLVQSPTADTRQTCA